MHHMEDTCNPPTVCYTVNSNLSEDEELSKLAQKRIKAKLTQQQLALMAQLPLKTLRKYEIGERSINKCAVAVAVRIADALGCDVKEILEPEESE
jgi:transcriptional regulator with XRE-family HTH domain